ncbi:hypothetical protein SDC9_83646 [bioreactor metagenome]|uniref:Uncharacterized protein n=1 Tax=bioreactor metagenome TaxID=1076179 RepID=A0A644ZAX7_9ZZZZ
MTQETGIVTTGNAFEELANFNLTDAMSQELEGLSLSFERIKIPSAGSTVFELPAIDGGEPETVKEFTGVILYHHPLFAYYRDKYAGGNEPPNCGSLDGVTGEGDPGGACAKCRYNQFGSGEGGGKACKNRRRIYILREGEVFPVLLSLPTGSLKEFTRYIQRLLSRGKKSLAVVTRFSLKKAVNTGGIAYSQAQFNIERVLTEAELAAVSNLAAQVKEYAKHVDGYSVDLDEFVEVPTPFDPATGEIVEP